MNNLEFQEHIKRVGDAYAQGVKEEREKWVRLQRPNILSIHFQVTNEKGETDQINIDVSKEEVLCGRGTMMRHIEYALAEICSKGKVIPSWVEEK